MYILFLMSQAQSKDLFKKTCQENLTELPRRLIKANGFNYLHEKDK